VSPKDSLKVKLESSQSGKVFFFATRPGGVF
jgi:hypothetical protein